MLTVLINTVQYPILRGSISVEKRVDERSTATFTVVDYDGIYTFSRGQRVVIVQPGTLPPFLINEFAGYIDTPGRGKQWAGPGLLHEISCVDNSYLADKRLVIKAYSNKTAGFIARDILTDYLIDEGVTEGDIQDGPVFDQVIFNYVKASECLDALKELTGFTWFIEEELKALYFIDRVTNLSFWQLDGVNHKAIKDSVYLTTGNTLYRNIQYVRGGTGVTALQTENYTGDGVALTFTVGYPIAKVPTVTVAAVPQAVGIKGLDVGKDCYWNKGDAVITFDAAPVGAIVVEYYGQYALISMAISGDVSNRALIEGTSGKVEEMTTEVYHETVGSITESAQSKLKQYCQEAEKFTYQTYESGLSPGQLQEITYAPFGFVNHQMLIESISMTANGDDVRYNVSCITGPAMGSWAKFFANMIRRQDNSIKIGDSMLLVLLQESEKLTLAETGTLDEDEFFVSGNINRMLNSAPISFGSIYNIQHERMKLTESSSESHHTTADYTWEPDTGETKWDLFTWS